MRLMPVSFSTDATRLEQVFANALAGLAGNVRHVQGRRVLIEGGAYPGIWLECGPHEGLLYGDIDPAVAIANHATFLAHQKPDGQFPCYVWFARTGYGHVQEVVPFCATAYELWQRTGDRAFLADIYEAGVRWDGWLGRHRDPEGWGLVQAFCEWDTGHDNSARWHGIGKACPGDDARFCNAGHGLPWYVPDLSSARLGDRRALARIARAIGREDDAIAWKRRADETAANLRRWLFDEADACFHDRRADGSFVRMRGEILTHPLREDAVDRATADRIWDRHLSNPRRYWTNVPFPSIAVDDPAFDPLVPPNSWGGASQALTALRTPRWLERSGRLHEQQHLLGRWRDAIAAAPAFMQQADPFTGRMSTSAGYSPAMLLFIESIARLHGVHRHGDGLAWNCALPPDATRSEHRFAAEGIGEAILTLNATGAVLRLDGQELRRVPLGTRLVTDRAGRPAG